MDKKQLIYQVTKMWDDKYINKHYNRICAELINYLTTEERDDIKPCPFCGGKGILRATPIGGENGLHVPFRYYVFCESCDVMRPRYYDDETYTTEEAKNLAISNWNERINYKTEEVKE